MLHLCLIKPYTWNFLYYLAAYQENCTSWNSHAEESKASQSSQSNRGISKKTEVASGVWILRENGSQWTGKTSERVSYRVIYAKAAS